MANRKNKQEEKSKLQGDENEGKIKGNTEDRQALVRQTQRKQESKTWRMKERQEA